MNFFQLINLPNILTLINLFFGCVAIVFLFNYRLDWVPYCIMASLTADFLDGFAARFTKKSTEIGKQLDSLADMVSFGVVPAVILFELLFQLYESDATTYSLKRMYLYSAPSFLVALFAALRLAKFNLDTRQSEGFIGLATPAATLFIVGLLLIVLHNPFGLNAWVNQKIFLYAVTLVISLLMVAEIPMFSFKFKSFVWRGNEVRYLFIILSLVLLAAFKFAGISLIIVLYILISIGQKIISK